MTSTTSIATGGRQRTLLLLPLLALACAPALVAPTASEAASYEVSACGDSPDERTNNSWELSNSRTSHLDSGEECPASGNRPSDYPNVSDLDGLWVGDYLRNDPGGPSDNVPVGSFHGPLSLDTTRYENGAHTLEVRTTDAAGNEASETRTVVFENPSSDGGDSERSGGNDGSDRSGGSGSGGGGGGSSSGGSDAAPPSAAPVPASFGVSSASLSQGRLLITGRATGPVRVSFAYRQGPRLRQVLRTVYPVAGSFRATIRLPISLRRAKRVSVLVTGAQGTRRVTARASALRP